MLRSATLTLALLTAAAASPALAAGDPAKGKVVFARCAICHDLKPGVNRIGPSLGKVVGRKAGTAPGFAYSPAMKAKAVVWNATTLDAYSAAPMKFVPGTKMVFAGIPNAADRANLVAYLLVAGK